MEKITITEKQLITKELWWQKRNQMPTATGYGKKIPTIYMVKHSGRIYRIYTCIFRNIVTNYIIKNKKEVIVNII